MLGMSVTLRRPPKTLGDYRALPDDVRAELLRGEIYVTPPPTVPHQDLVGRLYRALAAHVEDRGLGRVYLSPEVDLPSGDVVAPDVLFVRTERVGIVGTVVAGAPDLAIEVVSSHPERDRLVKRDLYAENGVSEYWVVESDPRGIQVLRLEGGAHVPAGWFTTESVLTSPSFPDLRLDVAALFRA
jgi:Uma2 family endonuclease